MKDNSLNAGDSKKKTKNKFGKNSDEVRFHFLDFGTDIGNLIG